MGSVLALKSFKRDFGLPMDSSGFANSHNAQVSSNVVSLLTAGCFFGAIGAAFVNERFGRRFSLMGFSLVFLVGAAIQVGAQHSIGQIYGGRVIAGLGIGGMSSITPIFVAENCPPGVRGRITGLFQEFLVIGSTFAYWLNYGVALHIPESTKQWRIPVAIQLIPGGFLFIGLWFLKESPRWLVSRGRVEEATASLAYMRCESPTDPEIVKEIAEIQAAIEEELAETEGVRWRECLTPGNRWRFVNGFCIMFWQQFSGTNSIGYYAPEIFQTIGVSKTNASLFATGVYGTVKVATTAIFLLIGIDKLGRRKSLIAGAAWMMTMMFILAAVLNTHPPTDVNVVSPASIAMVVMIYLYVIGYSASWGPIPWVYLSEIFPTRLRAYGVGMGAATQWLFNFCITEITPSAVNHIGYRTFIMFGVFCFGMGTFVFFFVKETKGLKLEDMDILFGAVEEAQRRADVEQVLHKQVVMGGDELDVQEAKGPTSVRLENVSPATHEVGAGDVKS
jgi:sugar porter (SP) family MFS transporter